MIDDLNEDYPWSDYGFRKHYFKLLEFVGVVHARVHAWRCWEAWEKCGV